MPAQPPPKVRKEDLDTYMFIAMTTAIILGLPAAQPTNPTAANVKRRPAFYEKFENEPEDDELPPGG